MRQSDCSYRARMAVMVKVGHTSLQAVVASQPRPPAIADTSIPTSQLLLFCSYNSGANSIQQFTKNEDRAPKCDCCYLHRSTVVSTVKLLRRLLGAQTGQGQLWWAAQSWPCTWPQILTRGSANINGALQGFILCFVLGLAPFLASRTRDSCHLWRFTMLRRDASIRCDAMRFCMVIGSRG